MKIKKDNIHYESSFSNEIGNGRSQKVLRRTCISTITPRFSISSKGFIFALILFIIIFSLVMAVDRQDYVKLIENNNDLINPYTIYEICKPNIDVDASDFNVNFNQLNGGGFKVSYWYNGTSYKIVNDYGNVIKNYTCKTDNFGYNPTLKTAWCLDYNINGSKIILFNDSYNGGDIQNKYVWWYEKGIIGNHQEPYEDWKNLTKIKVRNYLVNAPVGKCYKVKVQGHRIGDLFKPFVVDNIITYNGMDFVEYAWWNVTWAKKKQISVSNNANVYMDNNYTINFSFNTAELISAGTMQEDCNDFRLIYDDGSINYTIPFVFNNHTYAMRTAFGNEGGCNDENTVVWAKIPNGIDANSIDSNFYVFYDNSDATENKGNINNSIFIFYDDFDGGKDASKWTYDDGFTFANGKVCGDATAKQIQSQFSSVGLDMSYYIMYTSSISTGGNTELGFFLSNTTKSGQTNALFNSMLNHNGEGNQIKFNRRDSPIAETSVQIGAKTWGSTMWNITWIYSNITGKINAYIDETHVSWDVTDNFDKTEPMWQNYNKISLRLRQTISCIDYIIYRRDMPTVVTYTVGSELSQNTAPNIPDLIYNVTIAYNDTNMNCSVATYINDIDGDDMTVYFNATIDGIQFFEKSFINLVNGSQPSVILNHTFYSKGINVTCNIMLFDGTDVSGKNQTSINISNSNPSFISIENINVNQGFNNIVLDISNNINDLDTLDEALNISYELNDTTIFNVTIVNTTNIVTFAGNNSLGNNSLGCVSINLSVWDDEGESSSTTFDFCVAKIIVSSQEFFCNYINMPNINKNRLNWFCYHNSSRNYSCITRVESDGNLINSMPYIKIDEFGYITTFDANGGFIHVLFDTKYLISNKEFQFIVDCGDGTNKFEYKNNLTLRIPELYGIAERSVWAKDNMTYLISAGFLIIIMSVIFWWIFRRG